METIEIFAQFYSPRWGHDDHYKFVFSMERLVITHNARECAAVWSDNNDPEWEGVPLVDTMKNDAIYPPHGIEDLIIYLWSAWRNAQFNEEELQAELDAIADYVNASTHAKPQTDFWKSFF